MRRLILLIAAAALVGAAQPPKNDAGGIGNAENGKQLFTKVGCYECHGRVGQGGRAGPRIAPRPLPLQVLTMYVRHPAGAMPPYTSTVVSDAQLADIHAYLKSIPAPRAAKDIPLLNQ